MGGPEKVLSIIMAAQQAFIKQKDIQLNLKQYDEVIRMSAVLLVVSYPINYYPIKYLSDSPGCRKVLWFYLKQCTKNFLQILT